MTSKTDIATGVETDYVWDYRNRLVEVDQVVSGVKTVLALYTYDALNNPIKVVENGSTPGPPTPATVRCSTLMVVGP